MRESQTTRKSTRQSVESGNPLKSSIRKSSRNPTAFEAINEIEEDVVSRRSGVTASSRHSDQSMIRRGKKKKRRVSVSPSKVIREDPAAEGPNTGRSGKSGKSGKSAASAKSGSELVA